MSDKVKSNVDVWLEWETDHKREALENASRYFDENDTLTVNTLEAVYGRESSFGTNMNERGIDEAAGHFQFKKATAEEYGLTVTKKNDQRFDIDDVSNAAARYLKDLDTVFAKETRLTKDRITTPIKDNKERKNFVLAAYNGGQGRIAKAQKLTSEAGKNPRVWGDVKKFLELAGATKAKAEEIRNYIEAIIGYEAEFAKKSLADKTEKKKKPKKSSYKCTGGRWRTIDGNPVMICD
jgi:membrane-bound lytic murein transglycosylase MltF